MTLDYEGFVKSFWYTFIIMIYCLFGTQLAKYACSTSRKMFVCNFVFFARILQQVKIDL